MTTLDLQALRAWIEEPVAIQLATTGVGLAPHSVRCFGVRLDDDDTLRVGVVDAQASALLEALRKSRKLAVNLTHPTTFTVGSSRGRWSKSKSLQRPLRRPRATTLRASWSCWPRLG